MKVLRAAAVRDERGAIAPAVALTLAVLIGIGGLVVDVGVWYVQRRNLQGAIDAAALAAANHPQNAASVAASMLARNGFGAADLELAEIGYYCPDASLTAQQRFSSVPCPIGAAASGGVNAVRLTATTKGSRFLSAVLAPGWEPATIRTTATAARIDEAGLSIGSGAAKASLPIANAMIQSLLGGSGLNLTAAQYDGLLAADISAASFFDQLASELGVSAGNYGSLLSSEAKLTSLVQAQIDALNEQAGVSDVSAAVAGLQAIKSRITGSPSITLAKLFDLGVWQGQPIGSSDAPSALRAGLNAYQLTTFALQLANGAHAVAVPTSTLGVPGLAGATLEAAAIEPPQSAFFAFGPEGISVHTAQVRVKLNLQAAGLIQVPLYLEVASGDATITDLSCGAEPALDAVVKVRASSGLATLYLGTPPTNAMTNVSQPISYADIGAAPLINSPSIPLLGGVVQVRGKARATVVNSGDVALTFIQPPASGAVPSGGVSTTGYIARPVHKAGWAASAGSPAEVVGAANLGALAGGLLSNLELKACLVGCVIEVDLNNPLLGFTLSTLTSTLTPLLSGLDPLLEEVLAALGVSLGRAEVRVTGVRCGEPVLVL